VLFRSGETKEAIESGRSNEVEHEIGDLLFAAVNLARKCNVDAEIALQKATAKFRDRFNQVEDELNRSGKKLGEADLAELDGIWEEIKSKEREAPNGQ